MIRRRSPRPPAPRPAPPPPTVRPPRPASLRAGGLALLAGLLLAACGGEGGGDRERIVVGFSQIGAESAWRTAETRSIREEAERRGIELRFHDARQRQEAQLQALRAFIAQGVDAILLAPVVETGWEPVLREAKGRGIPVVLVDRGVDVEDESLYATLIASDFVEEGRRAARWLVEALRGEDGVARGNVVELTGTPGSAPALDRARGFAEVLRDHPGVRVVASQTGEFTRAKGKEVMTAICEAARGEGLAIDAVYAHNDDMALGAIAALKEAGLDPGDDVLVVSIDGVRAAFEAMIAGDLNCTIECNPLLGPAAFDAIEKLLAGEEVPRRIVVEDRLFEASDAAEWIERRAY